MNKEKIYEMDFSRIYDLLVQKAIRKSRTQDEVNQIICWLTGYTQKECEDMRKQSISYADFFKNAPHMNEKRHFITGVICGIRVENIQEPLMQDIRYLDKLIDELAKGKPMNQILRQ